MLLGGLDKLEAYPTLELRLSRGGAEQGKDADDCQAEDEAGDVGDRVAGVATATGNECLKSFHGDTVAQHAEDGQRRELAKDRKAQTEYGGRQDGKHKCVHQQIAHTLHPVQRCVTNNRKRIRRQQPP